MDRVRKFSIFAPALKRLEIRDLDVYVDIEDFEDYIIFERELEINAPALEHLDLRDHMSDGFSITNLDSLIEANVDIGKNLFNPEALYNVKFLSLSGNFRRCR
ncbi:hypothetical protein ACH5RR_037674 [Cinchona calisaya]|uniref:Uncharacterized protein n=1 Tax=Cinchona calisaya TaxID=153742 RepID=A0ABD2Y868_9GENT